MMFLISTKSILLHIILQNQKNISIKRRHCLGLTVTESGWLYLGRCVYY